MMQTILHNIPLRIPCRCSVEYLIEYLPENFVDKDLHRENQEEANI